MSSSFGRILRLTSFGESHGPAIGGILEGCPPGIAIRETRIQAALDRRRPGQSRLTTARRERDRIELLSGIFEGHSTGTPIGFAIRNQDADSSKYDDLRTLFRPGHADFTYWAKYGRRDHRGGGRASARETAARVAAGAIAEMLLESIGGDSPVDIVAWVQSVGAISADVDEADVTREKVDTHDVRCPDAGAASAMASHIEQVRRSKDTIGGCVRCVARNVPAGWGEPVFDKLPAVLASAMMSLPATRGFEIGDGFAATSMRGSEHNDPFTFREGRIATTTNHAGGSLGGISSGETVRFRVAFKPVSSIFLEQDTVDVSGRPQRLKVRGRHDPCVLPRAVPIVEAMCALALADLALVHGASASLRF